MRKPDPTPKQTVYLSKKIEFKKQSQTIQTVIKDKEIESKKKVIINLLKLHSSINDRLMNTKQMYKKQKRVYERKYSELVSQHQNVHACVLKLKVRKYRLEALENGQVRHYFGNQVKKYLRTWVDVNRHYLAEKLGGIENLKIATRISWRFQTLYYVKPQQKKITYLKLIKVINQNCKLQSAMFSVKQYTETGQQRQQKLNIQIYATSGKYFYLNRVITKQEFHDKILVENPLQNLLIFVKRKQIVFLNEYFTNVANIHKIERVLKICKFQMDVLREKKKLVLYKRLKISNIFESVYQIQGYKQLKLDILLSIKKKQIIRQSEDQIPVYANGNNRRNNRYGKEKGNKQIQDKDRTQIIYVLRCETILEEQCQYGFCIQDQHIMKNYQYCIDNFVDIFQNKYMIHLTGPFEDAVANKQISVYNNNGEIQSVFQRRLRPKIVRVIDFQQQKNLKKIIKAQSFIKMNICRKRYLENIKKCKKLRTFDFCCQTQSNIIISAYIKGEQVKFFVECLSLSSERKRQVSQDLRYDKKYWHLAQQFMISDEMLRIRNKYLIWEIQQEISACFQQVIQKYEQHQIRINKMKPLKAINRLKKFFIKSYLKRKRKTNILYIKKIQKQFGSFVLIIRKSIFLKNIAEAYLYPLIKDQKKQNRSNYITKILADQSNKGSQNRLKGRISCQQRIEICQQKYSRYKQISFFIQDAKNFIKYFKNLENFHNVKCKNQKIGYQKCAENEFYITESHFLLKPRHLQYINGEFKFVQRLASVNLNSQQILSQLQNYSIQKNMQNNISPQQYQKRTILKQRSMMKVMKKSATIIAFEPGHQQQLTSIQNQKTITNINTNENNNNNNNNNNNGNVNSNANFNLLSKQSKSMLNNDKNVMFFSFYKNKEEIFCLELFLIVSVSDGDDGCLQSKKRKSKHIYKFETVHQQEVSKKEVVSLGINLIYKIIAVWIHKNDKNYHFQQMNFSKSQRQSNGNGNSNSNGTSTLNENNSGISSNGVGYQTGRDRITNTEKSFKTRQQRSTKNL